MNSVDQALLIFVKNPIKGQVKTRLAATIGEDEALRAYKMMLLHLRKLVSELIHIDTYVFYGTEIAEKPIWPEGVKLKLQSAGDIGERMYSAFRQMCPKYGKCILIGSDCPSIRVEHIQSAFQKLDKSEVVIGPSKDGGYYLIGMHEPLKTVFSDIEWSTSGVFDTTVQRMREENITYEVIETLNDVDYEEDFRMIESFLKENYKKELGEF